MRLVLGAEGLGYKCRGYIKGLGESMDTALSNLGFRVEQWHYSAGVEDLRV